MELRPPLKQYYLLWQKDLVPEVKEMLVKELFYRISVHVFWFELLFNQHNSPLF